jgi:transposase
LARVPAHPHHIGPMSATCILSHADLPPPSARPVPHPNRGDGWNILADVAVFIFAVEAELAAMDRERVGVHRRGRKPDPSLRRLIGLIWMLTSGGMQWRIAGLLSGIPFTTLHSRFARWSRLGLWRRLGQRLAFDWRLACGDAVLPSAVVVDSRSLRSSPSAWARGFDGGKLVKGTKLLVVCDKHGALLDLEPHPANTDDRAGLLPALPRLAALGFEGNLLGDRGLKGALRRGGAGTRHPCLGLARWHAGRALPAARDPLGGGAAVRLVGPLSAAQHRVRPRARPLCRAHLDCNDLPRLTPARRSDPDTIRDLFAYTL